MDMRSLIHQGLPPCRNSSSSSSVSTSVSASSSSSFPAPQISSVLPVPHVPTMQPQSAISHVSAAFDAIAQAPPLVPLRFIIPNSRPDLVSIASATSSSFSMKEPEREPQHSMMYPLNVCTIKNEQPELCSPLDNQKELKKSVPKRVRTPKLSSRSTKSKARPGLRKGKWTEEESRYAARLTHYFKEGLLPLERGTMLRLYLSQKLNCEPMRITKKFTGGECIGKQVFRPCSPTPESRIRIMQAQLELVALEAAFIERLKENREEPILSTDEFDLRPVLSGQRFRPVPLKPRMYQSGGDDREGDEEDANAVGLLLDFFYKANRKEKNGSKKAASTKKDESATEEMKRKEEEGEQEQIKKLLLEISSPTVLPATSGETDTLSDSPTKRMRALSVSGCAGPAAAKRSRVGSFSTVTAA